MRRLSRILLNLAAGVSLLVVLATAAVLVRTFAAHDFVEIVGRKAYVMSSTRPGKIQARVCLNFPFAYYSSKPPPRFVLVHHSTIATSADWMMMSFPAATTDWRLAGMRWASYVDPDPKGPIPTAFIVLPLWVPMALTLPLPALRIIAWRRRRRSTAGLCRVCGYDLRATPLAVEQGGAALKRCSECGAINHPPP